MKQFQAFAFVLLTLTIFLGVKASSKITTAGGIICPQRACQLCLFGTIVKVDWRGCPICKCKPTGPCGLVRCGFGAVCKEINGQAKCFCRKGCYRILRPVCGSDGKTYDNDCLLRVARCEQQKSIRIVHQGSCKNPCASVQCGFGAVCKEANGQAKCLCRKGCYRIYRPVCGSDGKTYGNDCLLRVASCEQQKSIRIVHKGTCKDPCLTSIFPPCPPGKVCKVDPANGRPVCKCSTVCIEIYKPVCGSDGKTYSNECKLNVEVCLSDKSTLKKVHDGKCIKKDPCQGVKCPSGKICDSLSGTAKCACPRFCPFHYRPVCGSDMKTYGNNCQLNVETCLTNGKVTKTSDGPCFTIKSS